MIDRHIWWYSNPSVSSQTFHFHFTLDRTHSQSFSHVATFLRVSPAHSLLRYWTISLPPHLCQSLFLFRPGNVLARGGHRVIGFIPEETGSRPGFGRYSGIQASRCSVASTACRRRLSNVLSSDNYADEAVSYDNAAEDLAASSPPAVSGRNTWLQQICD